MSQKRHLKVLKIVKRYLSGIFIKPPFLWLNKSFEIFNEYFNIYLLIGSTGDHNYIDFTLVLQKVLKFKMG